MPRDTLDFGEIIRGVVDESRNIVEKLVEIPKRKVGFAARLLEASPVPALVVSEAVQV